MLATIKPVIHDVEQGTEAWHRLRLGVPTASRFSDILAQGKGGAPSKVRDRYMRDLMGELETGAPVEGYSNWHMERGHEMEDEIRRQYCFEHAADVARVGFVLRGEVGCSPDGFVGDDGLLEIKSQLPALLIETREAGVFPVEHVAQVQGALWITGRAWCDIAIGYRNARLFVRRAHRNEDYIARLEQEVGVFLVEMQQRIKRQDVL